ncbi:hypothetical protein RJ640_006059 [Escallonia rubra]|uniref:Uncharacterized protein n=1 Tax=Escallonia rubra TaxID=112253 RepID=A0AA88U3B7_9ASTE|nr:hypothetical protein RJ640_006059 [Escallonia rubra]
MAASKSYFARANYRFLSTDRDGPIGSDSGFELDESDVWGSVGGGVVSPDYRKPVVSSRKKPLAAAAAKRAEAVVGGTASSLPVNIPDWAKILKEDYKDNRRRDSDDDVDGEDLEEGGDRVPPHEFLARQFARTGIASFSVHEGIGRTLKGRDLSRIDGDFSFVVTAPGGEVAEAVVGKSLKNDVRAYHVNGHMKAKLDPLGLEEREIPDDLDPAICGFTKADLDREFFLGVWRMSGFLSENHPVQTLRAILTQIEQAYCGSIGYEYMHIVDREKCNRLREKIETPTPMQYNRQRHEVILDRLMWSTQFENFLATKWTAAKRFALEDCETLIPGMKAIFDRSADLGVETIVIGMSHIGRLNVLGNVVRKPLRQIFSEFSGGTKPVYEVGLYTGTCDDEEGVMYESSRSIKPPVYSVTPASRTFNVPRTNHQCSSAGLALAAPVAPLRQSCPEAPPTASS